jgi:uncharacterized membrane protein
MTMAGGEQPMGRAALAPRIEHPTRESIVAALRWIGPLSVPDLKGVLDRSHCCLAHVSYHVTVLLREGVLVEVEPRPAGAFKEKVYFLAS